MAIVKFELDPKVPASPETLARLKALEAKPDSEIDYSDIPRLDEKFWANAVANPFYRPTKTLTTVRVDSDVLMWLKSQGKGYQKRLNAILRDAMLAEGRELHRSA